MIGAHNKTFITIIFFFSQCVLMHAQEKISLLIVNAKIYSMNKYEDVHQAMAINGDRIVAMGASDALMKKYDADNILDGKGMFIFPGFIDAHGHLFGLGKARMQLDLRGTQSAQEVATIVKKKLDKFPKGAWIQGRGWDQNDWKKKTFPDYTTLDAVTKDFPIFLKRIDGHAAWANSRAMQLCGIDATTQDTVGGKILRDANGNPTGIFIDNAVDIIQNRIPEMDDTTMEEAYRLAISECLRYGLTSVHDMGVKKENIRVMKRMIENADFPFRVYAMIDGIIPEWQELLKTGKQVYGDKQLILAGVKLYADGALGSRGAALLQPYADDPTNSGIVITSKEEIFRTTVQALDNNLQVCIHAIGDRGNRIALNAFELARSYRPDNSLRLRIEHCQVLAKEDIPRFSRLGIIPSMQPTHCTSDMYWAEARLGAERVRQTYAWRSLIQDGSIIPGGSDFPVEDPNPLLGIYAAVTRRDKDGFPRSQSDIDKKFTLPAGSVTNPARFEQGWYGDERMTRREAILAFTSWAAYAANQDGEKGTLETGRLADFVLLSNDILTIPEKKILTTKVLATYIAGKVVYRADEVNTKSSKPNTR